MKQKAIFRLEVRWHEGKLRLPAKLESKTLGYFSRLEAIENFMSSALAGTRDYSYSGRLVTFRIFEVTKYFLDTDCESQGQWVYDSNGMPAGGFDGPDTAPFYGRNAGQCRFKIDDQVAFLQGNKLLPGRIAALPRSKVPGNILLDQSDDCYLVNTGPPVGNHSHPWVHHVFPV